MLSNKKKYNRNLEKVSPYVSSDRFFMESDGNFLKLDWNESLIPPSEVVRSALQAAVTEDINLYPDSNCSELKIHLGRYTGLETKNIEVFNGSDSALQCLLLTFLNPGDNVLVLDPTYSQILPLIQAIDGRLLTFELDPSPKMDLDSFIARINGTEEIQIVYLINPNNPTGTLLSQEDVAYVLDACPDPIFIVDEAYYEYAGVTVADLTQRYRNLVVTRTFSKAFSIAGLRLGYVLSHLENLDLVNKLRNGKEVNYLAQIGAIAALQDLDYMKSYVEVVNKTKRKFVDDLKTLGFDAKETSANYILLKVEDAEGLVSFFRRHKVLIRDRSNLKNMEGFVRITVGTPEHMSEVLRLLQAYRQSIPTPVK